MNSCNNTIKSEFEVEVCRNTPEMPQMHFHNYYEIYIQDSGLRGSVVSSSYYDLKPRDVLLLKPNLLHQSIGSSAHTRTVVYFTHNFLKKHYSFELCQRISALFGRKHLSLSEADYAAVSSLVRELMCEDSNDPENLIFAKLSHLLMILFKNARSSGCAGGPESMYQHSSISPIVAYVNENFLLINSIGSVADAFFISSSHLCRTFKKLTGYTMIEYINNLKIQLACHLLQGTNKTVTEIALDCGYNSTMYFCKIFKSALNITPSAYRKK
ncbi:MAG: AraC family transcriptional regulator [Christensenellales bacterium]